MLFLQQIAKRVTEVSKKMLDEVNADLPKFDQKEGSRIIGTLSDDLKRLCVVMRLNGKQLAKAHEVWIKEAQGGELNDKQRKQLEREHDRAHLEHNFIRDAFWTCLKLEFSNDITPADGEIVIVEDWKVVVVSAKVQIQKALLELVDQAFGLRDN